MSQQDSNSYKDSQLEDTIDKLLLKKVSPSNDFTARVLAEVHDTKVVNGPWLNKPKWIGVITATAAAIAIAAGLNSVNTSSQSSGFTTEQTSESANPFLDEGMDPELVEDIPIYSIDGLIENNDSLDGLDALLDAPQLLDLAMLLES